MKNLYNLRCFTRTMLFIFVGRLSANCRSAFGRRRGAIMKYTLASPYAFGKKGQIIGNSTSAKIITITNNGVPTFT